MKDLVKVLIRQQLSVPLDLRLPLTDVHIRCAQLHRVNFACLSCTIS